MLDFSAPDLLMLLLCVAVEYRASGLDKSECITFPCGKIVSDVYNFFSSL